MSLHIQFTCPSGHTVTVTFVIDVYKTGHDRAAGCFAHLFPPAAETSARSVSEAYAIPPILILTLFLFLVASVTREGHVALCTSLFQTQPSPLSVSEMQLSCSLDICPPDSWLIVIHNCSISYLLSHVPSHVPLPLCWFPALFGFQSGEQGLTP